MKVDEIIQIQKFFLNIFNALFVILGISIFGCAAWILFDKNSFIVVISSEGDVRLVAGCLALIGLVVVGVSILGCAGGQLESKYLLLIYMGFLIAIALAQIFVIFVLVLRNNKIEEFLLGKVNETITQYRVNETENHALWTLLDKVQSSMNCCGRVNATDWHMNAYIESLSSDNVYPCSCFNASTCPRLSGVADAQAQYFGKGTDIHTRGCQEELTDWLAENIAVVIGMDVGLIVIQILQLTFAVHIYQNIGRKMKQKDPRNIIGSMEVDPQTEVVYQDDNADYYDQDRDQHDYQHQQYNQTDYEQEQHNRPDYPQQDYRHQYYDLH